MPRLHSLILHGTKDTAPATAAAGEKPYQWRRGITRADALRRAGLGTARIRPAPERRPRDE